ncbi:MAG: hypothetical protein IGBAC_1997 [Ignavibacteriae bacterium]|nr:MAG: hypothetical protein IGBAC_1997 [Ignavibacteriota bacterium]
MKTFTITTIIAALIAIPIIISVKKKSLPPIFKDENKRYDINDYIADTGL